jgi:hypothetical protein
MANREMYLERAANTSFEDRLGVLEKRALQEVNSGLTSQEVTGGMKQVGLMEFDLDDQEVDLDLNPATRETFELKLADRLAA